MIKILSIVVIVMKFHSFCDDYMISYGLRLWFFFAWLHLQKVTETRVAVVSRSEWSCSDVALAALRICSCRGNVPGTSVLGERVHLFLLSGLLGLYSDVGSNLSECFQDMNGKVESNHVCRFWKPLVASHLSYLGWLRCCHPTAESGDPNVGHHCSLLDPPSQQDSLWIEGYPGWRSGATCMGFGWRRSTLILNAKMCRTTQMCI